MQIMFDQNRKSELDLFHNLQPVKACAVCIGCDKAKLTWCNVDVVSPILNAVPLAGRDADQQISLDGGAAVGEHGADKLEDHHVVPLVDVQGITLGSPSHVEIPKVIRVSHAIDF